MQEDKYGSIVKRVAGYLKLAKANRNSAAFLTGAGASISAKIPSAPKLVEQVAKEFSHCIEQLSGADRNDYGKCMSALSPDERRMLIKPHLDDAKINWGHIALAQIIKNGFVSRVLTFNFDLVLESALSLIGQQCPVYDFGAYPKADLALLAEPSIIHLHGQSYGFVHLNTEEETQRHKDAISPIITNTINTRPTIIIGYSGDCDPSAKTLQEQYSDHHRLAWLEYSNSANSTQRGLTEKYDYAEFSGGLDFDLFMIALATELQIWPPKILTNSSAHLLDELSIVTDYPIGTDKELDIFSRVKEHLGKQKEDLNLKAAFKGTKLPSGASKQDRDLHNSLKAMRLVSEAQKLITQTESLKDEDSIETLEAAAKKLRAAIKIEPDNSSAYGHLGKALTSLAETKFGKDAEELYELSVKNYEKSIKLLTEKGQATKNVLFNSALHNNLGFAIMGSALEKPSNEAENLYELAIEKLESSIELEQDNWPSHNLIGVALGKIASLKSGDAAKVLFEQAIKKIDLAIKMSIGEARPYFNRARVLSLQNDVVEAISSLEMARKFKPPHLKLKILKEEDFSNCLNTDGMKEFLEKLDD